MKYVPDAVLERMDNMKMHGCLVACIDWDEEGRESYYVCTRQLMTPEQAEMYVAHIDASRRPIVIHDNIDWSLRPLVAKEQ